jgi:hypothetical protein
MTKTSKTAELRKSLSFDSLIGQSYLELREQSLKMGLTKSASIPYILRCILETKKNHLIIADYGCSDGSFANHVNQMCNSSKTIDFYGIDFNQSVLEIAKKKYDKLTFINKNLYLDNLDDLTAKFDVAYAINTFHEVYSFYGMNGKFDHEKGINAVMTSLKNVIKTIKKGGFLIIFDGLESQNADQKAKIRFKSTKSLSDFEKFNKTYKPIQENVLQTSEMTFEMSYRYFTRFITKSRFINEPVWQLEQDESYQYFNTNEYLIALKRIGLEIETINTLSPNLGEWSHLVEILDDKLFFPEEHILIVAKKI